jgi:hypothetical protein
MAANYCDMFRHESGNVFLLANSGVMRGHLEHVGWELVARHRPMPLFPRKDIDKDGYALWRPTAEGTTMAKKFYGNRQAI